MPYRTQNDDVEDIVITFAAVTERKHTTDALEATERQAELANAAKSRFLAAASHDLRQPLQTLSLVRGILAKKIKEKKNDEALKLIARLEETTDAMVGMLNGLLDINQVEAGTVHAEMVSFPIKALLERLRDEFIYHAQAKRLALRVVPCSLSIHSDPRLFEQMIRNLLSNALKYTTHGKVLLGCRRRKGILCIEIWDTGIGIPSEELSGDLRGIPPSRQCRAQTQRRARPRSFHRATPGKFAGSSITRCEVVDTGIGIAAEALDRIFDSRSHPGKGSVFTIEVMLPLSGTAPQLEHHRQRKDNGIVEGVRRAGAILVVEDDPDLRKSIKLVLKNEGHRAVTASNGIAALQSVVRGTFRPDLILADYHLPNGMDGIQISAELQEKLHRKIPVIILTGDISTDTLRDIACHDCVQLNKPVKLERI